MTGIVTVVCLVMALLTAIACGIDYARNESTTRTDLVLAGATEAAVVIYLAVRVIDLAGGHRTSGLVIVVAYLIGLILILPIAGALSVAEPSRWGPVILASGALVVCVMFARINQIWTPHG